MAWMKSVYSDGVSEVGYDDETGEMLVRWKKSGKVSAYKVTEDVATEASMAASVMDYINTQVKPSAGHRYR